MQKYSISWIERLSIAKVSSLLKLISRLNLVQNPSSLLFLGIDKLILKIIWECKESRTNQKNSEKNKVRGLILPDFNTY